MKTPLTTWGAIRDALPAPWPPEAVDLDLDWMAARQRYQGIAPEPAQALAARWGCGRHTAWRRLKALAAPATACNSVQQAAPPEVLTVDVLEGACTMPATACTMPATTASTRPTDAVLSAPVEVEVEVEFKQRESEPTPEHPAQAKPAPASEAKKRTRKAKSEVLSDEAAQALLDRMHAIAAQVEPRTRKPALGEVVKPMRYCAGELVALAQETGRTPEGIIEAAWLWFWTNPDPWHRANLRGLRGYAAVLRPDNATSYAGRQADIEAAKAPPAPQAPAAPVRDAADDAWDVWVSGIEEARAWVAARRGSREAAAFTEAMEKAVHPNPIAEFYGALSGKRDRAMAREVFVREFRSRTALRLVSK
jgi:hypothetical protein